MLSHDERLRRVRQSQRDRAARHPVIHRLRAALLGLYATFVGIGLVGTLIDHRWSLAVVRGAILVFLVSVGYWSRRSHRSLMADPDGDVERR
jgi:hypothetical protein